MIFASLVFVFGFLPLALLLYFAAPGLRARNVVLTLVSYVFYAWWRPDFVLLMLFSTVVDYLCSIGMGAVEEPDDPSSVTRAVRNHPRRKLLLVVSMLTNLGLLAYFKYANFGVDVLRDMGFELGPWEKIVLPVGISFYTFQSMSYTIDVYRGEVKPVRSILDLACYVSMFPQLVAGPIVRYRDVKEQLVARTHRVQDFAAGCYLFAIGMVKKVLIADHVAWIADPVLGSDTHGFVDPGFVQAWIGVFAYALQIFFDFSGYSDMAVGLGLMLGFRMPKNFDSPYISRSITEFWRRWHISLSTWLRDYLYIPLGGNRKGSLRTYGNLAATMLLGGLWHGAAWTFILWGAYQGAFLILERLSGKRAPWGRLPGPMQVAVTFVIVLGGWTIFRARNLDELGSILEGMLGLNGLGYLPYVEQSPELAWLALGIGGVVAFSAPHSWTLATRQRIEELIPIYAGFLLALGFLAARSHTPFLYFQF